MLTRRRLGQALTLALTLAACGDSDSVQCGDGTMLQGRACVAACGEGTHLDNGVCVADTAPTSTCGPGTVLDNNVCVVDLTAPAPVTDFTATPSGSDMQLSWTAGEGSTSTVVARIAAGAYDAPAFGVTYTVGMTLPGGSPVIAVGPETTAMDTITTPGRYTYLAFSQNASGNRGFGREAAAISLPAQTATLSVDVANSTVTVQTQAANLTLDAADFTFDSNTGLLSFSLGVTNNTSGELFNIKAAFTNITGGSEPAIDNPTGTTDTDQPFVSLGFAGSLPGDHTSRTVTVNGVGATDTLTLDVTVFESAMGVMAQNIIDRAGGSSVIPEFPTLYTPPDRGSPVFTDTAFSPSGRYIYAITRYDTSLSRIDTTSGDVVSVDTVSDFGNGACLSVSHDGFLYVAYGLGQHYYRSKSGPSRIAVAKVDPTSLAVLGVARIDPEDSLKVRGCVTSGTHFLVGYGPNAYVVDTNTMTFVDADNATTDVIDPITVGASDFDLHEIVAGGTNIYASSRSGADIYSIDLATNTASIYYTSTLTSHIYNLTYGDGKLWWSSAGWDDYSTPGLFSYDGTTESSVPNYTNYVTAIGSVSGGKAFVVTSDSTTETVDLADGTTTWPGFINGNAPPRHRVTLAPTP